MKEDFNLTEYLETYYLVVEFIEDTLAKYFDCNGAYWEEENYISKQYSERGIGAKFELAKRWTDEFQEKYKDCDWSDGTWFGTVEEFLIEKNNAK